MQSQTHSFVRGRPRLTPLTPIVKLLEQTVTAEARVSHADRVAGKFVSFSLESSAFRAPRWQPGDKVDFQIGALSYRAYTPVRVDSDTGRMELLVYLHGHSPGARRVSLLRGGETVRIYGPRRSTTLSAAPERLGIFGDETSLALMAARQVQDTGFDGAACIVETDDPETTGQILGALGLGQAQLHQRRQDGGHLKAAGSRALSWLREQADRQMLLTGRARSIQALRKALLAGDVGKDRIQTHAFWADGKTALG